MHKILENPMVIDRQEKRFFRDPSVHVNTACDVCEQWEAVVRFNHERMCAGCAKEEGIEVI